MKRFFVYTCILVLAAQAQAQVRITPEFKAAVAKYDIVQTFHNGYAAVCRDGKWGYIDSTGTEVIPCFIPRKYDVCTDRQDYGFYRDNGYVRDFADGMVAVAKEVSGAQQSYDRQLKWGYMDATGRQVVDYIYDEAADFSEGLAYVYNDTCCGFIDKTGAKVIDASRYAADGAIYSFHNGLACIMKGDDNGAKYGYIDRKGNEVVPCIYDEAHDFAQGLAAVAVYKEDDNDDMFPYVYSFIDTKGNKQFSLKQGLKPGQFHDGMAWVTADERQFGFIDTTGAETIARHYATDEVAMTRFVSDFSEGYVMVGQETGAAGDTATRVYRLLNKQQVLSPFAVDGNVHQGLALNDKDGKFGFVDPEGKQVIPCQFDYTQPCVTGELLNASYVFNQGVAAVRKGGKWGYVDLQGNTTFK